MKNKLQVIFTNKINLEILDKDFYLSLFKSIVDLKKKKEAENELGESKSVL